MGGSAYDPLTLGSGTAHPRGLDARRAWPGGPDEWHPGCGDRDASPPRDHGLTTARAGGPPPTSAGATARGMGPAHHRGEAADRDDQGGDLRRGHVGVRQLRRGAGDRDVEALQAYARNLSERIIPRGVETHEVVGIVLLLRDVLARSLFAKYQATSTCSTASSTRTSPRPTVSPTRWRSASCRSASASSASSRRRSASCRRPCCKYASACSSCRSSASSIPSARAS